VPETFTGTLAQLADADCLHVLHGSTSVTSPLFRAGRETSLTGLDAIGQRGVSA
jgi:hypothetical protein